MKDILFFGIQGSGKGTQAKVLMDSLPQKFSYFSSGDMFRALGSGDNAIGNYIKTRIDAGQLIDDKVMNTLFSAYVYTVVDEGKSMLLDGYPRSIVQMDALLDLSRSLDRELLGVHFVMDEDAVTERLLARGRDDDTPESIRHRIQQFYDNTIPVIERFSQHYEVKEINAHRSIESIAEDVLRVVN